MTFNKWLDTFISEKSINLEHTFQVEGPSGTNFIPVGCVVEQIKAFPAEIQKHTRFKIIKIDFANGNVLHFFEYIAKRMAQ